MPTRGLDDIRFTPRRSEERKKYLNFNLMGNYLLSSQGSRRVSFGKKKLSTVYVTLPVKLGFIYKIIHF